MEIWFQLSEKIKHVQTFQLIENKNERIVFGRRKKVIGKQKTWSKYHQLVEKYDIIAYMFQLVVSYN